MAIIYALLLIVILAGTIGIFYAIYYNKLQECKLKIDESESIIDEGLRSKYDFMTVLDNLLVSNVKDNKISFKELSKLKDDNITNFDLDRKLSEILKLMNKIKDDYKELDSIKEIRTTFNDIKRADEKISAAKRYYNKYTSMSNELVRKFPSNIVAKIHGVEAKNFFDGKDMNDDVLDDFKL